MPLTDLEIRTTKASEKPKKLFDGGGLHLRIDTKGTKLWRLAYRYEGKERTLSFGPYPDVPLKDARAKRDEAKALLAQGIDPGQQRKIEKLTRAVSNATTFKGLADEYVDKQRRQDRAPATISKIEWLISLAAKLNDRPIADIQSSEVLAVLKTVEKSGHFETAKRLRATIGSVFRYAIATGRASNDPTFALRGALIAPKVTHRPAITDHAELGKLLRTIDGFKGQPATIAALKLMAYLFPRPGELRFAAWSEFDLEKATWTIPAARTKMRREHVVPLPRQALAILKELQSVTGGGRLAFPGYGISGGVGRKVEQRPLSENTLNGALRRMGYTQDEVTAHGFRATASTLLNESGKFSADAIERALAHQDPDPVRRAYARGTYWNERVEMAQWWADFLDTLKAGGKVIELAKKRS